MIKKITIQADKPWLRIDFSEIYDFRWVFWMLILRDIKLRYKHTFLGATWVIIQPLITTLIFALVFGRIIKVPSDGLPYVVFALCGLVPWLFFSQSLQRASQSLLNDSRLITKVYFPRIFIPLSGTFGVLIDFLIALCMLFFLMGWYGIGLTPQALLIPVFSFVLFIFSSGFNLVISALNVYYRDFKHIIPFLIQLWMYASPIVYSGNMIPERYRLIYSLNPIAGIIDAFRWATFGLETFPAYSFTIAAICSVMSFVGGVIIFRKIENNFADVV